MIKFLKNSEELKSFVEASGSLLVYFYNDDCAPCMSLRPKVEFMIREKFPLMDMIYVNGTAFQDLIGAYQAYSYPALIFYFEGKEFLRYSKYVSLKELETSVGRIYRILHGPEGSA